MGLPKYEDVDQIKDVDGVVVVFTRNRINGKIGAGFFKVFDRDGDGDMEKTAFLNERHLDAVLRLIPQVRKRMLELAPKPEQGSAPSATAPKSNGTGPVTRKAGMR